MGPAEPELEINGASSRAVFRFSGSGGTLAGFYTASSVTNSAASRQLSPSIEARIPSAANAARAIAHLSADHADALLDMARSLGGCRNATVARGLDADTAALTLEATTPNRHLAVRIPCTTRSPTPRASARRWAARS